MDKQKEVTIQELADACGVSISTVSKALRRSERISADTIRRVEEKAAELGYVGSQAARALSAKKRRVAVVLPTAMPELCERYRVGCREAAPILAANGITVTEVAPEETAGYDGVLLHASMAPLFTPTEGQAVAVVGGRAPALHPVVEVTPDTRVGGRLAAQFLAFATDGSPVAVLSAHRGNYIEDEAVRGFRELSARLGVSVTAVVECGDSPRNLRTELRRLMMSAPRTRGIFVTAPLAAAAATAAGEMRRRPTVVGLDFTASAQEALRAGGVAALLYSGEERQATTALTALCEALTAHRTCGHVDVRQELVLRSNLENYLN